jgi:hypothetical protein
MVPKVTCVYCSSYREAKKIPSEMKDVADTAVETVELKNKARIKKLPVHCAKKLVVLVSNLSSYRSMVVKI